MNLGKENKVDDTNNNDNNNDNEVNGLDYIDQCVKQIKEDSKELDDLGTTGDKSVVLDAVFNMYSNFLAMEAECRDIRADIRKLYKFKDIDVRKWMKDQDKGNTLDSVDEK